MLQSWFYGLMTPHLRFPTGKFGRIVATRFLNIMNYGLMKQTVEVLAPTPRDRVLDIGFGGGESLRFLMAKPSASPLYGVEPSDAALAYVNQRFRRAIASNKLTIKQGKINPLDFPNDYFQKIMSANNIYFWESPLKDLAEVQRVLSPGGKFVVSLRSKKAMEKRPFRAYGYELYSPEEVIDLLKRAGFERIEYQVGRRFYILETHIVTGFKPGSVSQ